MTKFLASRSSSLPIRFPASTWPIDVQQHWVVEALKAFGVVAIGMWCWSGAEANLWSLALMPLFLMHIKQWQLRWAAAGVYFGIGLWPVQPSIITFFPSWPAWSSYVVWIVFSGLSAAPWAALGSGRRALSRALIVLGVCLLTFVPPWATLGWCHPLLAVGYLWHGAGVAGLVALTLLWCLAAGISNPRVSIMVAAVIAALAAVPQARDPVPAGVVGVHTRLRTPATIEEVADRVQEIADKLEAGRPAPGQVIAYPETILANWRPSTEALTDLLLAKQFKRQVLILGTDFVDEQGRWNGAAVVHNGEIQLLRARQPLVLGLWRPWDPREHISADWTANERLVLPDGRVALLRVCSEEFTPFWTAVDVLKGRADMLIGIGNTWWATVPIQERSHAQHADAVGRMFGLPVVRAVNHGLALSPGSEGPLQPQR